MTDTPAHRKHSHTQSQTQTQSQPHHSSKESISSTTPSTKPPVKLPSSTHLDPGAYVRGTHPITLGNNILIHPRAHLISLHGPLTIGDESVIGEKSIIGGPLPPSTSTSSTSPPPPTVSGNEHSSPKSTSIGSSVHIYPHVTIHAGADVSSYVTLEPHTTILPGVHVGTHSKICAGITVDRNVPQYTVILGDGSTRRLRRPRPTKPDPSSVNQRDTSWTRTYDGTSHDESTTSGNEDEQVNSILFLQIQDEVEKSRVKAIALEREAATAVLRNAARTVAMARKK